MSKLEHIQCVCPSMYNIVILCTFLWAASAAGRTHFRWGSSFQSVIILFIRAALVLGLCLGMNEVVCCISCVVVLQLTIMCAAVMAMLVVKVGLTARISARCLNGLGTVALWVLFFLDSTLVWTSTAMRCLFCLVCRERLPADSLAGKRNPPSMDQGRLWSA